MSKTTTKKVAPIKFTMSDHSITFKSEDVLVDLTIRLPQKAADRVRQSAAAYGITPERFIADALTYGGLAWPKSETQPYWPQWPWYPGGIPGQPNDVGPITWGLKYLTVTA